LVAAPMHIIADQPRHWCNPAVPGPPGFIAVAVVTGTAHDGFSLRRIPLNIRHNQRITREGKIRINAADGDNLQNDKTHYQDTEDGDYDSSPVHRHLSKVNPLYFVSFPVNKKGQMAYL